MQRITNFFQDFVYGIPTGPEEIFDYIEGGDLGGVQRVVHWHGHKIFGIKDDDGKDVFQLAEEKNNVALVQYLNEVKLHQEQHAAEHNRELIDPEDKEAHPKATVIQLADSDGGDIALRESI